LAGGKAGHGEPALFLVGAGSGSAVDVVGVDRLAADRAGRDRVEGVVLVNDLERRPVLGRVTVAPGDQREEDRLQVAPLLGQQVLEALRVLAVAATLEDPSSFKVVSRALSTLVATPSEAWNSSNRRRPKNRSRRISIVQRSPRKASGCAIEQFFSAYPAMAMRGF
jgi:hypothetical protein